MTGLRLVIAALVLSTACRQGESAPGVDGSGLLVLERTEPSSEQLLRVPAVARYCERDSVLSIVGMSSTWSAALALRTGWAPDTGRDFTVGPALDSVGTAAAAARALNVDSQQSIQSRSGTLSISSVDPLAGSFTLEAGQDSTTTRLTGRFERLSLTRACAS